MTRDDPELLARIGWNTVTEPGDPAAGVVVEALGAVGAWQWLLAARRVSTQEAIRELRARVREVPVDAGTGCPDGSGAAVPVALTVEDGTCRSTSPVLAADRMWRVIGRALTRWLPRLDVEPRMVLLAAGRIGAVPVVPGDPQWPARLDDLGASAPLCLWVRGGADLAAAVHRSVAVVGARAASAYGERVAEDLARELALAGVTVVSGGAYGIDAAAHRGTLAPHAAEGGVRTVALLAGGPDRLTPAGNADLLRRVLDAGGLVVAESPPGRPPSRSRFLLRNRLIAALTEATVVVEAGWRSGALSTAQHAHALLRPVGAVPGPVTSPASAGCHRLLRRGAAVCVTNAAEVIELLPGAAPVGADSVVDPARRDRVGPSVEERPRSRRARVLDALGPTPTGTGTIAARAGLSVPEVEAELGLLELTGRVRRSSRDRWAVGTRTAEHGRRDRPT